MKRWVTAVIWVFVVSGGVYFPLIRSPEMTNSQLFRNYWWFYVPALILITALTAYNYAPKQRMSQINKRCFDIVREDIERQEDSKL